MNACKSSGPCPTTSTLSHTTIYEVGCQLVLYYMRTPPIPLLSRIQWTSDLHVEITLRVLEDCAIDINKGMAAPSGVGRFLPLHIAMFSEEHLVGRFGELCLLSVGIARCFGKDCLPPIEGGACLPPLLRGNNGWPGASSTHLFDCGIRA